MASNRAAAARRCMEEMDVAEFRRLWPVLMPHLPAPASDAEALATLHHARTQCEAITLKLRAYSHRWLDERSLPSGLPDHLKPHADRLYPRAVEAVGISVNSKNPVVVTEVRGAMEDAVLEAAADRRLSDAVFVTARMQEARRKTIKQLFG